GRCGRRRPGRSAGRSRWPRRSRFFSRQVLLVGLGGQGQTEFAHAELGLAEEVGGGAAGQGAGPLQEGGGGGPGECGGELLGLGFLFGAEGVLHDDIPELQGELFSETPYLGFVYKDSTNFRDAHTPLIP